LINQSIKIIQLRWKVFTYDANKGCHAVHAIYVIK